jgi:hypothetical protein
VHPLIWIKGTVLYVPHFNLMGAVRVECCFVDGDVRPVKCVTSQTFALDFPTPKPFFPTQKTVLFLLVLVMPQKNVDEHYSFERKHPPIATYWILLRLLVLSKDRISKANSHTFLFEVNKNEVA